MMVVRRNRWKVKGTSMIHFPGTLVKLCVESLNYGFKIDQSKQLIKVHPKIKKKSFLVLKIQTNHALNGWLKTF